MINVSDALVSPDGTACTYIGTYELMRAASRNPVGVDANPAIPFTPRVPHKHLDHRDAQGSLNELEPGEILEEGHRHLTQSPSSRSPSDALHGLPDASPNEVIDGDIDPEPIGDEDKDETIRNLRSQLWVMEHTRIGLNREIDHYRTSSQRQEAQNSKLRDQVAGLQHTLRQLEPSKSTRRSKKQEEKSGDQDGKQAEEIAKLRKKVKDQTAQLSGLHAKLDQSRATASQPGLSMSQLMPKPVIGKVITTSPEPLSISVPANDPAAVQLAGLKA